MDITYHDGSRLETQSNRPVLWTHIAYFTTNSYSCTLIKPLPNSRISFSYRKRKPKQTQKNPQKNPTKIKPKERELFSRAKVSAGFNKSPFPGTLPHSPQILVFSSKCHFIILLKPLPLFTLSPNRTQQVLLV